MGFLFSGCKPCEHTGSWEWVVLKESSCTATGLRAKECLHCHNTFDLETVPLKEHELTEWAELTPSTCTEAQVLERHCKNCATQNETKAGDLALGHSSSSWMIDEDSDCVKTGSKHKECTVCHEVLETGTIELKAHDMTEWVEQSPATCTEAQVLERHCKNCTTKNETKDGTAALGHYWTEGNTTMEDNCYVTSLKCVCGETSEKREPYKTVYIQQDNCTVSIRGYSNLKVRVGDVARINIYISEDDRYILEKLVYVEGSVVDDEFVASGEEQYIYNNSFVMPDSDVQIICKCVAREQQFKIKNNKAYLMVDKWWSDYMTLNTYYFSVGSSSDPDNYMEVRQTGLSWDGENTGAFDGVNMWVFDLEEKTFNINYYTTWIGLSVGFTFASSSEYTLLTGTGKFSRNSGESIKIKDTTFLEKKLEFSLSLKNNITGSIEQPTITFTLRMEIEDMIDQHRVTFIGDQDDQIENLTLNTGDKITTVPEGDWYCDGKKWDFETDVVTSDIVLFKRST